MAEVVKTITPQNKLIAVAKELGLRTLPQMQGSTGAIFHAKSNASTTGQLEFFEQPAPFPLGNWPGEFEVNEAMAIDKILVSSCTIAGGIITDRPVFSGGDLNNTILLDLYVGNQRVIKEAKMRIYLAQSANLRVNTNAYQLVLEEPIVIPPQVTIRAVVRFALAGATSLRVDLFGTRVLLNTKTTL